MQSTETNPFTAWFNVYSLVTDCLCSAYLTLSNNSTRFNHNFVSVYSPFKLNIIRGGASMMSPDAGPLMKLRLSKGQEVDSSASHLSHDPRGSGWRVGGATLPRQKQPINLNQADGAGAAPGGGHILLPEGPTLSRLLLLQVRGQSQIPLFVTQRFDPLLLFRQLVGRVPRPAVVLGEVV